VVLDLYHRMFEGTPLRPNEYVLSVDEKPSIQARCRCHPTLPPVAARALRVKHEYDRRGALQYRAAWDCHRAKRFGHREPLTGIEPLGRLMAQVMTTTSHTTARRVPCIVDNGSSRRGAPAIRVPRPTVHVLTRPRYGL